MYTDSRSKKKPLQGKIGDTICKNTSSFGCLATLVSGTYAAKVMFIMSGEVNIQKYGYNYSYPSCLEYKGMCY